MTYRPIGVIRTPFEEALGMPIQPPGAMGVHGHVEVYPEYGDGLKDLEGFSHIILIYHFHRSGGCSLQVRPFLDRAPHGVFATRAPSRPNPIGISVVRLIGIEGCVLSVEGVDMLDGTPLLDIKPYVPDFDAPPVDRIGWLSDRSREVRDKRADQRFV